MNKLKAGIIGGAAVMGAVGAAVTAKKVYEAIAGPECPCDGNCECHGNCCGDEGACDCDGQCGEPEDAVPVPAEAAAAPESLFTPTVAVPD